jgi:hypothetical protein
LTDKLLPPKFLTSEIAALAVERVFDAVFNGSGVCDMVSRKAGHVVIIVPAMKDERDENYPSWPDYPIHPHVLYEQDLGEPKEWRYDYANIAKCKALQLWHDRNDDRTDCMPHLLFSGDTPFWGGVKRRGIVVAFSGVQPYLDKMISGMIADMCVGLAYWAWMNSDDKKATDGEACFLA